MSRIVRIVLVVIVAGLIVIQLIPVAGRDNPPVLTQIQWDSAETDQLMRAACYDCHSNETVWPWYAYVAPVSWLVAKDVREGREHLNLSEWTADRLEPDELIEQIESGKMPLAIYLPLHPEADLSSDEKAHLIAGLRASLGGGSAISGSDNTNNEGSESNEEGSDND